MNKLVLYVLLVLHSFVALTSVLQDFKVLKGKENTEQRFDLLYPSMQETHMLTGRPHGSRFAGLTHFKDSTLPSTVRPQ